MDGQIAALFQQGKYDGVTILHEENHGPMGHVSRYFVAVSYLFLANYQSAKTIFIDLKKQRMQLPDYSTYLALTYVKTGQLECAKKTIVLERGQSLLYFETNVEISMKLGMFKRAGRLINRAKAMALSSLSLGINEALLRLFRRDLKSAEDILLKLLETHPDQVLVVDQLVKIYMKIKAGEKCEKLMLGYLRYSPNHIPYLWALVMRYGGQGRYKEMKQMLRKISESDDIAEHVFREIFAIPAVFDSKEARIEFRDLMNQRLDDVIARGVFPNRPDKTFSSTPFYMVYHDELNRDLFEKMSNVFRQGLIKPPKLKKITQRKKPKIAIISQNFYKHSVMDFYFHTIVNLPEAFDVTLIYIDPIHIDDITKALFERANTVLMPSDQHEELIPLIVEGQFDMIVYPEVGMSSAIYYLSMLRLAPIQVGLMGHPETSGSKSMDYFVSWKNFHYDQPKKQFTETVVQLEKLPICYDYPLEMDGIKKTRKSLGLPNNHQVLFTVPMMLFKIQPEFDEVIIKIIQESQQHRVVLICYNRIEKFIFDRLKKKLTKNELKQLIFCLPFKRRDYYALIKHSNVVLETFPFGGGNTVLHAMAAGTPVISLRANQLKGAFGAGYYDYLGETEYSVNTVDEYIQLAIRVANDATVKSRYKAMIQKNKDKLYGNMDGPREFYEWLNSVLNKKLGYKDLG